VLRHSQSETQNPNVIDWTDTHAAGGNATFFADAIADLSEHDGLGLIGLVGSSDLPGVALRRAQSILRWDRRPSLWSHAFLCVGGGAIREVALHSRAGHFPEPADNATEARSKAICAVSALMPGIAKNVVLASLGAPFPKISASGASSVMMASISLRRRAIASISARPASAARAAAPKPAIPATFSVPARWPFSWPPPLTSGRGIIRSDAATIAPTPLGPPILCEDRIR